MATVLGGRQTGPLEEVVLAQAFQLEAQLNVLERHEVIRKTEVLEEIKAPHSVVRDETVTRHKKEPNETRPD